MPYKIVYNRRGRWYPGSRFVTSSYKTRKAAVRVRNKYKKRIPNDHDVQKLEVVYYKPKKRGR